MGLKASGHLRFLTSLPSNFSLKKRGQQLKRMYSAMPEAVKTPSVSSSPSSGMSILKLSSLIPAASLCLYVVVFNLFGDYCIYR